MSPLTDPISHDAALAIRRDLLALDGVDSLYHGAYNEIGLLYPGDRVGGLRLAGTTRAGTTRAGTTRAAASHGDDPDRLEVHVVAKAALGTDLTSLGDAVRAAVARHAPQFAVDVVIADIADA